MNTVRLSTSALAYTNAAERKCCGKCAFRAGSPERSDPYSWMLHREHWDEGGGPFLCHESVPGHTLEVVDDKPRLRVCAGWQACSSTGRFPRSTPDPDYFRAPAAPSSTEGEMER